MKVEIVIPTYKRRDKLIRLLNSIERDVDIVTFVYFDNNDTTWVEIAEMFPWVVCLPMRKKYQAFGIWNHHLMYWSTLDIMVYLCDDTELYPDTIQNAIKHFEEKFPDTDGVVTFKQENINGSDSAMGCIGRTFSKRYPNRQCFCPNYVSFYADTEIGDYAKKLGKFHYGEDCLINHYHPVGGTKPDDTHWIIRGKDKNIDIRVNAQRKQQNLLWGESDTILDRENI